MTIDSIGTDQLQGMLGLNQLDQTAPGTEQAEGMQPQFDSVKVSKMGENMQELAKLAEEDPEQFAQVTASMADKLDELAASADGQQGEMFAEMASKFRAASEGGGMEALRPDAPPQGMKIGSGSQPDREDVEATFDTIGDLLSESLAGSEETTA